MNNKKKVDERGGWGFPETSRKAHYFVDMMSLCRKWGFYNGPLEQGNDDSIYNCAECKRLLAKRKSSV
jgi:hypothetical protein